MVAASAQIAPSVETKPLVLKPLFERSPAKFWGAHQDNMLFDLHLARKTDASLSLNQFIARYVGGLPTDLPSEVVKKLIEMLIETWEKQPIAQPLETA